MTGRVLGLDYGTKRCGVAVSDGLGMIANPLEVIPMEPRKELLEKLKKIAEERQVVKIVVGLPYNMDGTEGEPAKNAREFGEQVAEFLGIPVEFWDERLSSWQAERALEDANLTMKKRKKRVDKVAAQFILQSYLDAEKE